MDLPADLAGRYRVDRRLGGGAYAEVYLAHQNGTAVALKIAGSQARPARFSAEAVRHETGAIGSPDIPPNDVVLSEARLLAGVTHPAVARLVDSGMTGGRAFLATEWVAGRSWRAMLDAGELPGIRAIVALVETLVELNESGQLPLHGDLKPENLFFDDSGRVRMIDPSSGLRRFVGEDLHLTTRTYNPLLECSDLPALGVLLMYGTTGFHPIARLVAGADTLTFRVLAKGPSLDKMLPQNRGAFDTVVKGLPVDLHPRVEEIALRCLGLKRTSHDTLELTDRFSGVQELAESLRLLDPDQPADRGGRSRSMPAPHRAGQAPGGYRFAGGGGGSTRREIDGRVIARRYRLEELINKGGTGDEYRASMLDGAFGPGWRRSVALYLTESDSSFAQAEQAGRVVRRMFSHAHSPRILVPLEGGLDDDGSFYLVMEFLDPKSCLRSVLARHEHGLPLERALRIAHQLCAALADVQDLLIVHSTLKPSRIFLRQEHGQESVVVSGWQHAHLAPTESDSDEEGEFDTDVTCPPPPLVVRYASPEQVVADRIDCRSDLFAVGVILFEMLTGTKRFQSLTGKGINDLLRERADRNASDEAWKKRFSAASLPGPIVDVLSRLLAFDADERFARPELACDALEKVLAEVSPDSEDLDVTFPGPFEAPDVPSARDGDSRGTTIDEDLLHSVARGSGEISAEFIAYVEAGLDSGVPEGWRWSRTGVWADKDGPHWMSRDSLHWWIGKSTDYDNIAYELSYVREMRSFVINYGNGYRGIGPAGFEHALLLPVDALTHRGLDHWAGYLVRNFPPNEGYDYT